MANTDHRKDVIFDFLPRATVERIREIYGPKALTMYDGWDDEVQERLSEAMDQPVLMDEYAMNKAFPVRTRQTGKLKGAPPADPVEKFKISLNHYAKGLLLAADASERFEVTRGKLEGEPISMMGYKEVHHEGVLEFGLSLTKELPFSDVVVKAATKLLQFRYERLVASGWDPSAAGVNLNNYLGVKASYPRGKNTGLPWMASGSDRLINNMVLAIDAGLACALVRGYPYQSMFDGLALGYFVFSRFQRSNKAIPLTLGGQRLTSIGIEARRRIINSTPKVLALAVKPFVKFITVVQIQTPEFEQDRANLKARIAKAATVRATDASRFDLRSGGVKLRQGLQVMWDAYSPFFPEMPHTVYDLMMLEAFLPTAVTLERDGGRVAHWTSKSSLRSGASTTSRVGSVINLMYDMTVYADMHPDWTADDIVSHYVKTAPSTIQGDDMLKTFATTEEATGYFDHLGCLESVGMSVEEEHPTKFLGYLVRDPRTASKEDVSAKATGLYHSGNPLMNMFFPERFRTYAVASMLSRYVILKLVETTKVNEVLISIAREPRVAMEWYRRFYAEMMPILRPHYADHPSGAARAYFGTLVDPAGLTEVRLAAMIKHDEDELLRHIAQTARFDVNMSLFGEEADVMMEDDYLTASLQALRDSYNPSDDPGSGHALARERLVKQDPRLIPLLSLFNYADDHSFVTAWRKSLDITSRKIDTPMGAIYFTNL